MIDPGLEAWRRGQQQQTLRTMLTQWPEAEWPHNGWTWSWSDFADDRLLTNAGDWLRWPRHLSVSRGTMMSN